MKNKVAFTKTFAKVSFSILLASVLFASCGALIRAGSEGNGTVRVFTSSPARNVAQEDKDAAKIKVYFNGEEGEEKNGVFTKRVWAGTRLKITAEAVAPDGRIVGKGQENIVTQSGANDVLLKLYVYDNFVVTIDGKATGYTNFVDAWAAANGQTATIKMNADATANTVLQGSNGISPIRSGTLTLDLNGHTLTGDKNATEAVIFIQQPGSFILKDSGSGGKITGGIGGVTLSSGSVNFIMEGGTISAHSGTAVYVNNTGTFTMSGGTITGNADSTDNGGGVRVLGTFTMSGGRISGNTTVGKGGGVYVDSTGTFTMTGGIITGNTSSLGTPTGDGGGVYVKSGGTFTQNGGSVTGNSPDDIIRGN